MHYKFAYFRPKHLLVKWNWTKTAYDDIYRWTINVIAADLMNFTQNSANQIAIAAFKCRHIVRKTHAHVALWSRFGLILCDLGPFAQTYKKKQAFIWCLNWVNTGENWSRFGRLSYVLRLKINVSRWWEKLRNASANKIKQYVIVRFVGFCRLFMFLSVQYKATSAIRLFYIIFKISTRHFILLFLAYFRFLFTFKLLFRSFFFSPVYLRIWNIWKIVICFLYCNIDQFSRHIRKDKIDRFRS